MKNSITSHVWLCCLALVLQGSVTAGEVSYERDVIPILERRCNQCHHPEETRGGLDLTRRETMLRGGDELGPAIVVGKPDKSPLLRTASHAMEPHMPEGGDRIADDNGNGFTWWMAGGAVKPGIAWGATDERGYTAVENPVHVRDLHATILWMCGLDHRKLQHRGVGFDDACQVVRGILT